ncbi:hypothetical protein FNF31_07288 [Cafeteria roenbergensis]|uniref:Signal recognition particle receptor subunit beta n=1 Tax=Cafeteria roenbergensis TaxID=33653 RepID=A0A5A8C8R0_CAFRO|nr:hypothetical protein FNF31_07288 [Cafeteria roenbergensis]KAA0159674.1 hypothetical protein FNF28_05779 [Cafeteria roenbergensis]
MLDTIPGVPLVASLVDDVLGTGDALSRVIALMLILLATLALAAVVAVTVLDDGASSKSGTGAGPGKSSGLSSADAAADAASASTEPTVVLIGPSGAGKTALLHRLCTGNLPRTVSSLQVSRASASIAALGADGEETGSADLRVVDVPGHPRAAGRDAVPALLRSPAVRAVLVLVDATSKPSVREGAAALAELLTSSSFVETAKPVMVVGTRAEVRGSMGPAELRRAVEAELDNLRRSQSALGAASAEEEAAATEAGGGAAGSDRLALGRLTGEAFSLDRDSPVDVQFDVVSCSDEVGPRAGQHSLRRWLVGAAAA